MAPDSLQLEFDSLIRVAKAFRGGNLRSQNELSRCLDFAVRAHAGGRADLACALLQPLTKVVTENARLWLLLAIASRDEQKMEDAVTAIRRAAALAPNEPQIALGLAQLHYETGRPALALFHRARQLAPENLDVIRNTAGAMMAEGDINGAERLLSDTLALHPDWLDGHKSLANLRTTTGDRDGFDASYADACARIPGHLGLRLAWFHALATARDWAAARTVIREGRAIFGDHRALNVADIYLASESGEAADDPHLFDPVADLDDPGLDLCRIRHHLRAGRPEIAQAIGLRHAGRPSEALFWPYLSIAWRLTGDPRARWLDGDPPYIGHYDLDFSAGELGELEACLRELHIMRAPYFDQSVRGGTQTDRPLLLRADPTIQRTRAKVTAAVAEYASALPPPDPKHPLLRHSRTLVRFSGSWSVRLDPEGFHVSHTHPMGWISSALYVALPTPESMGPAPSGWLRFGMPPPELGLDLGPLAEIEPKPGRLVLFPSTMWHGTAPFRDGERLTIAFDVKPPARP